MDNLITDEEMQIAAGIFIAMRQQLGLEDNMMYNYVVETKSGVQYIIKCEKKVVKEVKNND